ncbi:MAG: hypothetical protein U9O56_00330 [Campylobacterota bacterium]|nr:hypothetical protein [Campylobacterota bacterium]
MNKTVLKTALCVALASSMFVGCTSTTKTTTQKKEIKKPTKDSQGRPLWVSNPDFGGNIGVVSIVSKKKIKNKKKLHYIAKLKAQAAFESRKGTRVDANSQASISSDGSSSYEENIKTSSNSVQTVSLIEKAKFEDKDNYYLWMVKEK